MKYLHTVHVNQQPINVFFKSHDVHFVFVVLTLSHTTPSQYHTAGRSANNSPAYMHSTVNMRTKENRPQAAMRVYLFNKPSDEEYLISSSTLYLGVQRKHTGQRNVLQYDSTYGVYLFSRCKPQHLRSTLARSASPFTTPILKYSRKNNISFGEHTFLTPHECNK